MVEVPKGDEGVLEGLLLLRDLQELDVVEYLAALLPLEASAVILAPDDVEEGQSIDHSRVHLHCGL